MVIYATLHCDIWVFVVEDDYGRVFFRTFGEACEYIRGEGALPF